MTDFAEAFKRGQDAAARAAAARAEIDEIFVDVSRQLAAATAGKIEIGRQTLPKPRRNVVEALAGAAYNFFAQQPDETEPWIAARNPQAIEGEWVRLARWDQPPEGYPCQLIYDKTDVRCHDRTALTDAIEDMLASALIGENLRKLLSLRSAHDGLTPESP